MLFGHVALVAAAAFLGAAFYIHAAEQPARLALDDGAMLLQWQRSYERALVMQVSLIVVSALAGIAAWSSTNDIGFLAGAVVMLVNIPTTYALIMPINRRLMATAPAAAGSESREDLRRWNRLHGLRTALALCAVLAFASAQ